VQRDYLAGGGLTMLTRVVTRTAMPTMESGSSVTIARQALGVGTPSHFTWTIQVE
jgi:hypothetical protein